jgi:hypothetical protein
MTALTIQMLDVQDCEMEIERAYFYWGCEYIKTSGDKNPVPKLNWETESTNVRRSIGLRGYYLYDGWPTIADDEVGATEVYVSIGINSGVLVYDVVRFLERT